LIDAEWPGRWAAILDRLQGRYEIDDLNDAFAALWTARRIANGIARSSATAPPTSSASAWKCGPNAPIVFHSMENFFAIFPRYGKNVSTPWKKQPDFSTVWKIF
jgi:hypothetical protein